MNSGTSLHHFESDGNEPLRISLIRVLNAVEAGELTRRLCSGLSEVRMARRRVRAANQRSAYNLIQDERARLFEGPYMTMQGKGRLSSWGGQKIEPTGGLAPRIAVVESPGRGRLGLRERS
jgi:hypothetical protein